MHTTIKDQFPLLLAACIAISSAAVAAQEQDARGLDAMLAATPAEPAPEAPAEAPAAAEPAPADAQAAAPLETVPVEPLKPEAGEDSVREKQPGVAQLDDVVVTATKRAESQRTIASTVNVLSGDDLEKINARELQDYLRYIPGVTLQEGETNDTRTISIRGVGPQPGANTTTGVLIENVSMGDPYASYLIPDLDPFDIRDLEVLKGPQGTLFGAAALNGAIRYVLNKPQLNVWEGKAFVNWIDVSQGGEAFTGGAALNVPLGNSVAIRGVVVQQEIPGLYDDVNANGKNDIDSDSGEKQMYRVLALWEPSDKLRVNAFHLHQKADRDDISISNNHDGEFVRTDTPGDSYAVQAFDVSNLDVQYDFDWATVVAEASYSTKFQRVFYDGSAILEPLAVLGVESLRLHKNVDTEAMAYELRLVSPEDDGPWKWIVGAYYNQYQAYASLNTPIANTTFLGDLLSALGALNIPGNPFDLLFPTEDGLSVQYIKFDPIEATEKSVFGEIERKFFDDRLSLGLGGRLYQQELTSAITLKGLLAPYGEILGYSDAQHLKSQGFNPKATIKFEWSDSLMLYAAVSRGFQFGGLNAPAPIPTDNVYSLTFRPSTIWSYEGGVRTDWFDNTLQIDLTAFLIDWTDMQLRQDAPSGNTDYIDNVGKAKSVGAEMALRWLTPINGLMLVNSASYIEARVNQPYTTSEGVDIPKGTLLPAAPLVQSSTGLNYTELIGPVVAGANLTYSYIGQGWNTVTHDLKIFDFGTLDAGITLGFPGWTLSPEISLSVTNATDERALVGGRYTEIANRPGTALGAYNRPRTIGMRISAHF